MYGWNSHFTSSTFYCKRRGPLGRGDGNIPSAERLGDPARELTLWWMIKPEYASLRAD